MVPIENLTTARRFTHFLKSHNLAIEIQWMHMHNQIGKYIYVLITPLVLRMTEYFVGVPDPAQTTHQ